MLFGEEGSEWTPRLGFPLGAAWTKDARVMAKVGAEDRARLIRTMAIVG